MTQQLTTKRLTHGTALTLVLSVVFCVSLSSTVEASILLPENGVLAGNALDAEQLIADLEAQESSSSGTSSSNNLPLAAEEEQPPTPQEDLVRQLAAATSHTEGSTSGTSSSSSGSSSTGGGASLLIDTVAILPDGAPARRYAFESALLLPDAPGNQLLRPPQG